MPRIEGTLFCDGCGAEIAGSPLVSGKLYYCCEECHKGLECDCALYLDYERRDAASDQAAY